jgi:ectoine hydroxylase-related dioxygenase (phytanoyl-CoA dioxygenase family)
MAVLIPLIDHTAEVGPTQVILRSHHLQLTKGHGKGAWTVEFRAKFVEFLGWLFSMRNGLVGRILGFFPLRVIIPKSSVVVFDGRSIHRGLPNTTTTTRPMVSFDYILR